MNELEMLVMEIEFKEDEIAILQEEVLELKARKMALETSDAEVDNPFWEDDGDDPRHGRYNKQINDIKAKLLAGDRVDRMYAAKSKTFNCKFVITMAKTREDVEPWYMDLYVKEQGEQFAGGIIGTTGKAGFLTDSPNYEEGEVEGYLMPWAGNFGPVGSRERMEAWWADPSRLKAVRYAAKRSARWADFYYMLAQLRNKEAEYMKENPWYIPKD